MCVDMGGWFTLSGKLGSQRGSRKGGFTGGFTKPPPPSGYGPAGTIVRAAHFSIAQTH